MKFKAGVALEPIYGGRIIQEIAKDYAANPLQVLEFRKRKAQEASEVFECNRKIVQENVLDREPDFLHRTIRQMALELECLR